MGLFTMLFGKKKSEKDATVKFEIMGKTYDSGFTQEQIKTYDKFGQNTEDSVIGFRGKAVFSNNALYSLAYTEGNVALIDTTVNKRLFITQVIRPHECKVSNNGNSVCVDWGKHGAKTSIILIFDKTGNVLYSKRTGFGISYYVGLSDDGKYAVYDTLSNDNKLYVVDTEAGKVIKSFSKDYVQDIIIRMEDRKLIFKYANEEKIKEW